MTNDLHVLESLPAYALGSLDGEEAGVVAEHLSACPLCRARLSEYQAIVGQLGLMAPVASPSVGLEPRLMARIGGPDPAPARSTRRRFSQRLAPLGAIAGLVLIVILVVSNYLLWQRLDKLEVLSGPLGMRAIALQNTSAAEEASGFLVVSADGQNGVLVVDELPPLDPGQEYQLWLVRNGESTSGAVFAVDESGYRGVKIAAAESLLTYAGVLVTIEPAGGSPAPAGTQVLGGSLFNP